MYWTLLIPFSFRHLGESNLERAHSANFSSFTFVGSGSSGPWRQGPQLLVPLGAKLQNSGLLRGGEG
jgi:hypothetical protein